MVLSTKPRWFRVVRFQKNKKGQTNFFGEKKNQKNFGNRSFACLDNEYNETHQPCQYAYHIIPASKVWMIPIFET